MENKNHPLGDLMGVTMSKIREMIDVNTIIGKPITVPDGVTIIPVSKVSFGFGTGGSDIVSKKQPEQDSAFGGGSGAGVSIHPVAFLIVKGDSVKLMPVAPPPGTAADRVVEMVPDLVDKVVDFMDRKKSEEDTF